MTPFTKCERENYSCINSGSYLEINDLLNSIDLRAHPSSLSQWNWKEKWLNIAL